MGPTALGIDPWGGGATAPEGQSPLVGWANSPWMLRVRWLNRDSSWLTTKPMRANACRRSRGTTTTIAGHNHHDQFCSSFGLFMTTKPFSALRRR